MIIKKKDLSKKTYADFALLTNTQSIIVCKKFSGIMRPGKRERIALQQKREEGEISQKEYIKATRDATRAMKQRKSDSPQKQCIQQLTKYLCLQFIPS